MNKINESTFLQTECCINSFKNDRKRLNRILNRVQKGERACNKIMGKVLADMSSDRSTRFWVNKQIKNLNFPYTTEISFPSFSVFYLHLILFSLHNIMRSFFILLTLLTFFAYLLHVSLADLFSFPFITHIH